MGVQLGTVYVLRDKTMTVRKMTKLFYKMDTSGHQTADDLDAVVAQLQLANKELHDSILQRAVPEGAFCGRDRQKLKSLEHLERDLQRARSKHDAALQKRQKQVEQLEQLAVQWQELESTGKCLKLDCLGTFIFFPG